MTVAHSAPTKNLNFENKVNGHEVINQHNRLVNEHFLACIAFTAAAGPKYKHSNFGSGPEKSSDRLANPYSSVAIDLSNM